MNASSMPPGKWLAKSPMSPPPRLCTYRTNLILCWEEVSVLEVARRFTLAPLSPDAFAQAVRKREGERGTPPERLA